MRKRFEFILVVPPVKRRVARALVHGDHSVLVAAGIDDLGEERLRIDAHLVHGIARHVVARSRVRIDEAQILAFEVLDCLGGRAALDVQHRVVALGAVGADLDRERLDLGAGDVGPRIGRRAVHGDVDIAGALTLDDGRVVVRYPQGYLCSELFGEIVRQGRPAIDGAGGVLVGNLGEDELGIFAFPVLCGCGHIRRRAERSSEQEQSTTGKHD